MKSHFRHLEFLKEKTFRVHLPLLLLSYLTSLTAILLADLSCSTAPSSFGLSCLLCGVQCFGVNTQQERAQCMFQWKTDVVDISRCCCVCLCMCVFMYVYISVRVCLSGSVRKSLPKDWKYQELCGGVPSFRGALSQACWRYLCPRDDGHSSRRGMRGESVVPNFLLNRCPF